MSTTGAGTEAGTATECVARLMHAADESAWSAAALVLGLGATGSTELGRAAGEVLRALDVDVQADELDRTGAAAQAAAPLLQTAALLRGDADIWGGQSDEALLAQGRTSAQGAALFGRHVFPALTGLTEALGRPGARMLDVGTGVAALAVAYAELYPELTVVGLDVLPRALTLGAATVAASAVGDRVVLREQDVATLDETAAYTLAWLPAPFVPEQPLRAGVTRISRALVPGGWLVLAHGRFTGDRVADAISRFKTVAFGGTALDDGQAARLLGDAGLVDVRNVPTPPGAPALTAGRRPAL
ncbi:MAG: SAM-dependent methyltransferase [Blastococcus sp.]